MEMTSHPSDPVIHAWVCLTRAQQAVQSAVEAALKAADLPALAWYDCLLELSRCPDGLTLPQLEARLLIAQHGVSRLTDRMAAAGVIAKDTDAEDGRRKRLTLTDEGRTLMRRMRTVYFAALQTALGAHLDDTTAETLIRLLAPLSDAAGARR